MSRFARSSSIIAIFALTLLALPRAEAQPTPAPSKLSLGVQIGPSVPIEPSGDTLFWFGAELRYSAFSLPVLINPQSGLFKVRATPRFVYDIELMPKLAISPFGGLDANFGFGDVTVIAVGLTVGARASYQLTPSFSVFAEPLTFDLPLFVYAAAGGNSDSEFKFRIGYRAMFGAAYHF
jgi:hypothetical protein